MSGFVLAHLVTTGLGPFYDGILHFFRTPQDVLPVLALSLFAGQRGKPQARAMLFVLPAAWLAGGLAGLALHPGVGRSVATASLLVCGVLVAADVRLPLPATIGLAVAIGLLHGLENGAASPSGGSGVVVLLGIVAGIFVVCALGTALVISLRPPWTRIAVRVAGSWIAAIGLLLLGWAIRPQR